MLSIINTILNFDVLYQITWNISTHQLNIYFSDFVFKIKGVINILTRVLPFLKHDSSYQFVHF